jgi:hypothetical protein
VLSPRDLEGIRHGRSFVVGGASSPLAFDLPGRALSVRALRRNPDHDQQEARRVPAGGLAMGTQLYLPAGWARHLESRIDPVERLAELEKDRTDAKAEIREILDRLADKHGATARDVTVAMRSIDDTLSDLLYDQERMLQHEIEDLSPV